tara:strand:+ start:79 stop:366 length:288 start_codon:yes stop_codon:yes gene_type:complete
MMDQIRHEEYMKQQFKLLNERNGDANADMVNKPPHYNQAGIECIEAIKAATGTGYKSYLQGNIIKYIWRYEYKNGVEDLKKAHWYLERLIKEMSP